VAVTAGMDIYSVKIQVGCQAAIAGKPAPTGGCVHQRSGRPVGCLALALALAFDLLAPSRGRAQVLRSGQPGMDAGLAAHGHGWPIAAGPRSRTGARVCRATARHRTKGARALGYLGLFQVTRCKSGTVSSRYRRNGYLLGQNPGRLSGRYRWQASSYSRSGTAARDGSVVRSPSLASQLLQLIE